MNQPVIRSVIIIALTVLGTNSGNCQTTMPEVLTKGSVSEQMNWVETSTRIYENYRAIREDMFQMLKNNSVDSITKAKNRINGYVLFTDNLNLRIDSLNTRLNATKEELKEITNSKNEIRVIGIDLDKAVYNSVMWTILAVLAGLLIIGFLIFKRNLTLTFSTKKDLSDLKTEFEAYRQKNRIDREKERMDHFNEIKKLKGR
jgi:hypothetical protein